MSERKEGWYWVKITPRVSGDDHGWEAVRFEGGLCFMAGRADYLPEGLIASVGPRIPTPDEPWQCVPKEPTGPMYNALKNPDHTGGIDFEALLKWRGALSAAPKPEDV